MCDRKRVRVVEKTMATRSGGFVREGRRWKWGKPDVESRKGTESAVVLVCFGEEGAPGRVATMADWIFRAIANTSDRSRGRMDREIDVQPGK